MEKVLQGDLLEMDSILLHMSLIFHASNDSLIRFENRFYEHTSLHLIV